MLKKGVLCCAINVNISAIYVSTVNMASNKGGTEIYQDLKNVAIYIEFRDYCDRLDLLQ